MAVCRRRPKRSSRSSGQWHGPLIAHLIFTVTVLMVPLKTSGTS